MWLESESTLPRGMWLLAKGKGVDFTRSVRSEILRQAHSRDTVSAELGLEPVPLRFLRTMLLGLSFVGSSGMA